MKNEKMTANITNPITTSLHTNSDGTTSLRVTPKVTKFDFAAYKANNAKTANNANNAVDGDEKNGKSASIPVTMGLRRPKTERYMNVTFVTVKVLLSWLVWRVNNVNTIPQYIYKLENDFTFSNIWYTAVHMVRTVIFKRLENRPDNANLRMLATEISKVNTDLGNTEYYYKTSDDTLSPVYDLVHVAIESLLKAHKNKGESEKWLTMEKTAEVPSNVVIVGLDGKNTVEMKTVTKPIFRYTYDVISHAMSSYDTFKWNDNRFNYVELDAIEADGVEYKMYERLSYHIDNAIEYENIGFETEKCNFNKEEMAIIDFRMAHNYVGYKTIAHSLKKSENTIKSQMQRIQTKALKAYGWKKIEKHVSAYYTRTDKNHEKGKKYIAVRSFIALDDGVTPINRGNVAKCNMIDNIVKFNRKTELLSALPIKPENFSPKGNYTLNVNAIVCHSKQYENYTEYSPTWTNENIYRSFLEILDIINYR